ncbi:MAG: hypothetical protein LUQ13_04985 [Methanomicrobiales archaeon]|nr:hypothetical protein [Methanomicrobiales archaeon]
MHLAHRHAQECLDIRCQPEYFGTGADVLPYGIEKVPVGRLSATFFCLRRFYSSASGYCTPVYKKDTPGPPCGKKRGKTRYPPPTGEKIATSSPSGSGVAGLPVNEMFLPFFRITTDFPQVLWGDEQEVPEERIRVHVHQKGPHRGSGCGRSISGSRGRMSRNGAKDFTRIFMCLNTGPPVHFPAT